MLGNVDGLYIAEDAQESGLKLAWRGPPPYRAWRWFVLAIVTAALAGSSSLGISAAHLAGGNPEQQGEAAILGCMSAVILCLIYFVGTLAGNVLGFWHELTWDAIEGMFWARRRGFLLWGRETKSIPFAAIRLFSLEMASESQLPISTKLSFTTTEFEPFHADVTSLGFENRDEGFEFLLTVAHVVRAAGYRVHENSPRKQVLQIWLRRVDYTGIEEPEDQEDDGPETDFLSIPRRGTPLSPPAPARPAVKDSVRPTVPFNLQKLRESLQIAKIEDCEPGVLVRIIRPSAPWSVHALIIGLFMLAGGAVGYWFVFGFLQNFINIENDVRWLVTGFTAFTAGCTIGFLCWNNLQERELCFDWRQNCLTLRYGLNSRQWPLTDIQQLVLSTKEQTAPSSDDDSRKKPQVTGYKCRLDAFLLYEDLIVIETEKVEPTSTAAQDVLAPLGSLLASELQVKYSRGPHGKTDADDPSAALRLGSLQLAALVLIGIVASCLIGMIAVRDYRIRQTVAQLKALNVDATRMGQYGYNKSIVVENYVSVRMTNNGVLKQHGQEIGDLLRSLPKVAFDLEKSNLTNADLAPFHGVKVVMANISETQISDVGVILLAEAGDLIYLQADETPVSDVSVDALKNQPNLRFLFIRQTLMTPEGRKRIYSIRSMEVFR
jgi:hypothetical protein